MKRVAIVLLLSLLILAIMTPLQVNVHGKELDLINIDDLVAKQTLTGFLFPRLGLPAFVTPGSSFKIVMYAPTISGDIVRAYLYKGGLEVGLDIDDVTIEGDKLVISVSIPDVRDGLYSLYVESKSGASGNKVYVEHNSVAVKEDWTYPIKMLRYSDTHYDNRRSGIKLRENFLRIIWQANFLNPDFIIITGDILNSALEDNYKSLVRDLINMLRVPIVMVPGNHDHHFEKDLFTYYLAPSNVSINIGPLHLILMDTGPGSMGGTVTNGQIEWLKKDLEMYSNKEVKIIASHHPFSLLDEGGGSNKTGLEEYLSTADVDLILHGHMHYLMVEDDKVPFRLTDPNAYEGGSPYSGFRLIYILGPGQIEWKYNGTENPYPIFDLRVYEYQHQNGSNLGYYLMVENDMDIDIEGYVTARIGKAENLILEGITMEEAQLTEYPEYTEIRARVVVKSGETRMIKIYGAEDNEPPTVTKIDIQSLSGKKVTEILRIYVWDMISGVSSLEVEYTLDNASWETAKVLRLSDTMFYTEIRHSTENGFGLRLKVMDPEGNLYDSGFLNYSLMVQKAPATGAGEQQPPNIGQLIIPVVIIVIVGVMAAFLLRKRH